MIETTLHNGVGLAKSVGWISALHIFLRRMLRINTPISVYVRDLKSSLEVRPTDSDPHVLSQIFGRKEYFPEQHIVNRLHSIAAEWIAGGYRPLIVDGGANVGYSAAFFSNVFPEATVLAVEPDQASFEQLSRNCEKWPSIRPIHGALWENADGILLRKTGTSWSNHVSSDGDLVPSTTLNALTNAEPRSRILILKLDIEGAERNVVAASPEAVRSAMCIMIEPHDFMFPGLASMEPMFRVLQDRAFDTAIKGENLFFFAPELSQIGFVGQQKPGQAA